MKAQTDLLMNVDSEVKWIPIGPWARGLPRAICPIVISNDVCRVKSRRDASTDPSRNVDEAKHESG